MIATIGGVSQLAAMLGRLFLFLLPLLVWWWSRGWGASVFLHAAADAKMAGNLGAYVYLSRLAPAGQVLGPAVLLVVALILRALRILETRRFVYLAVSGVLLSVIVSAWAEWSRLAAYHAPFWSTLRAVDGYLVGGCLAALVIATLPYILDWRPWALVGGGLFLRNWFRRKDAFKRAPDAIYGDARFLTPGQMAEAFPAGGIIVGEAYRADQIPGRFLPGDSETWGQGGRAPLLRYDGGDAGHALLIGGTGAGKTSSVGVPTCLEWQGGLVYLDPSGEVGPMVRDAREGMGRQVIFLDPEASEVQGFNALDWIDPASSSAPTDVAAVAAWVTGEKPKSKESAEKTDYFELAARGLVECLIAWVVMGPKFEGRRDLRQVRGILSQPAEEVQDELAEIARSDNSYLKELAAPLVGMASEQWSGVYGSADNSTKWLSVPNLASLVAGDAFTTADFVAGNTDVFIQIPLKVLSSTPAAGRLVLGALLNSVYEARGLAEGRRALFLLDEVYQLGYMASIERARDTGRKYRISLYLMYQSVGQIADQWGGKEGKRSWFESTSFRQFTCIQDLETAKEISEACGNITILQEGTNEGESSQGKAGQLVGGSSGGQRGKNVTPVKRPLINPEDVTQLRDDAQLIMKRGSAPMICGKAYWFRRPEMAAQVKQSRF